MAVRISYQIGNRKHVGRNADRAANTEFVAALGAEVRRKAADNVQVNVADLRSRLDSGVKTSLDRGITYAARNLMGIKSDLATFDDPGSPAYIAVDWADNDRNIVINPRSNRVINAMTRPQILEWKPLSPATIREKMKSKGADRSHYAKEKARQYFIDSGTLQREILELAKNVTTKTGTVQLLYKREAESRSFSPLSEAARSRKVGQLKLRFLPNLPVRAMAGLQAADFGRNSSNMLFESSLGLSSETVDKLRGAYSDRGNGHAFAHRPLLQPIFTYWVLNRIPRFVSGAISRSIEGLQDADRRAAGRSFRNII